MSSNRHSYHDGRGEVRIYATLPGCTCSWCTNKRREAAGYSGEASPYKKMPIGKISYPQSTRRQYDAREPSGDMSAEEAGEVINMHAKRIAKEDGLSLHEAQQEACRQLPGVAALYINGLPTHARFRKEDE